MDSPRDRLETWLPFLASIAWVIGVCYVAHTFQPVGHAINRLGDVIHDGQIKDSLDQAKYFESNPTGRPKK